MSFREMAEHGANGNEGIAFWLGSLDGPVVSITHVLAVRGPGIVREPLFLQISSGTVNALTDVGVDLGAVLVGQIHAHPGGFVDLSPTDRHLGIAFPQYLSLVAPGYAQRPETPIGDCGVHVFCPPRGFIRLSAAEVSQRLLVVEGSAAFIVVEAPE
jgi:proteasome lid subunit RPN8/RPN11